VRDGAIRPRVLLVTGAYFPEISAAAVQCRTVARRLIDRAEVSILTTSVTPGLPAFDRVDGVAVHRVHVDVRSAASKAMATVNLASSMLRHRAAYDMIHVHGFSQKNLPVAALGRVLGKPVVLTLHTAGQDEPDVVKHRGAAAYWAFTSPKLVMAVSSQLEQRWRSAGLPGERVRVVPNGIDTERFRPATADERTALRTALGWPVDRKIVLFVGFFSRDKRPDLLLRAWRRLDATARPQLVFVGAKATGYYEIDDELGAAIRRGASEIGAADRVSFVEPTNEVERCFRAADVYVLPSIREAHPLALLEAMACGLPVIAARLPGATDAIVDDGVTGRLVPPDDEPALAGALREMLENDAAAHAIGERARAAVVARYDIGRTADAWLDAYRAVLTEQR
jgi:glycosyltransferase involved in cell wall biosynthesis